MSDEFNPKSHNAMFATILLRLDQQDKTAEEWRKGTDRKIDTITDQVTKTNGRVNKHDQFIATVKAKALGVAFGASAIFTAVFWILSNHEALSSAIQFFLATK